LRVKKVMGKARNAAGLNVRQGFATRPMAFLAQPAGNVVKTAPLVVTLLAKAAGLGVVARLDWRCFNRVRTCKNSVNRP
jgi:hypothetical protein